MTQPPARPLSFPWKPLLVLAAFLAFSLWVLATSGLGGLWGVLWREPWGQQLLLDLAISLSVACAWLWGDARRRGLTPWPFAVASVLTGSIGVLAYLVWRGLNRPSARAASPGGLGAVSSAR